MTLQIDFQDWVSPIKTDRPEAPERFAPDMGEMPHLHVEVMNGSGPPIFLVHGMLSSNLQWRSNLAALATVARPVIFELWVHGSSPTPELAAHYAVGSYIAEFERVRKELGAPRITLCGLSFGAGLTMRYSLMHPEAVIAQVFTNSMSALTAPAESTQQTETLAAEIEEGGIDAIAEMPFHPKFANRLALEIRAALVETAARVNPRAVAMAIRHTLPGLSLVRELEQIKVPTLLVNGTWEKSFQPLRESLMNRIPASRVVDLPAGHAVNLEVPEAFNSAVVDFLLQAGDLNKAMLVDMSRNPR